MSDRKTIWGWEYPRDPVDDPSDPAEIEWMLLTLLTLEPEEQERHFERPVPAADSLDVGNPARNPVIGLCNALWEFQHFFAQSARLGESASRTLIDAIDRRVPRGCAPQTFFSREDFMNGESWRELRSLARAALAESGLGPHPIRTPIVFADYTELLDDPHLPSPQDREPDDRRKRRRRRAV